MFIGEKEWKKLVEKMKKIEENRDKETTEKKLDLNVE